jgi:predicted aspartyl protease
MNPGFSVCTVFAAGFLMASVGSVAGQTTAAPGSTSFLHGIDVSINGSAPLHFGLDTGLSFDFSITPEKAQQLGLPVTGHHIAHFSDKQEGPGKATDIVRATKLTVAGHTVTGSEGVTLADAHHDGTLGITLFRDVLLTLDFPHDQLSVSDGALPIVNGHDVLDYTTNPDATFGPLRVTPTVTIQLAGQTLPALLDTGARKLNADVIVPPKLAATLPLSLTGSAMMMDAAGNKYPSYTARLNGDLILGDVVLHNPTVLISERLGFVNLARVLNSLEITIDQRNRRLRITRPSSAPSVTP